MNRHLSYALALLAILLATAGCAPVRTQPMRASLLPAPPAAPVPPNLAAEAPEVRANLYPPDMPAMFREPPVLPPRTFSIQPLLRSAEAHFQAGKQRYQEGDTAAARREFDAAVDILLSAPEESPDRPELEKRLAEMVESIHRYDISGLGAGELAGEPVFDKAPLDDLPELTFPVDPRQRSRVLEMLQATVSQLPLEVNDEVLRFIQYFSTERGRKIIAAGLRRMGRYHALIRRVLDEEGVPQELIHLAQAESGFLPRAVSRKRASGMWQFMQFRGREYGLTQTRQMDERFDPEKATRAAARHLRDLYTRFGDWYLAMAAYNCGPVVVEKAIERTGYADFWELRRRNVLPKETASYVPITLAMIIMAKNPAGYALDAVVADPPLEYSTVELAASTHLALVADIVERPVTQIQELNPALLRNVGPAGYSLRVPQGSAAAVASGLEIVPADRRDSWRIHRVGEGESVAAIARRFRTSAKSIADLNHMDGQAPAAGSLLLIPAAYEAPKVVSTRGRSTKSATRSRRVSSRSTSRSAAATPAPAKKAGALAYRQPPASRTSR